MPDERHPLGQHEADFEADADLLRRLFAAKVPVFQTEFGFRLAGPLPPGFEWREDEGT